MRRSFHAATRLSVALQMSNIVQNSDFLTMRLKQAIDSTKVYRPRGSTLAAKGSAYKAGFEQENWGNPPKREIQKGLLFSVPRKRHSFQFGAIRERAPTCIILL